VYILENAPWGEEKNSANVIWGKKYENVKEKGRKGKERGRRERK
jgi:hypothetical protein